MRFVSCFVALLLGGFMMGCHQTEKEGNTSSLSLQHNYIHSLALNLESEPYSLDPRQGGDGRSQDVVGALFEGLMRLDKDGQPAFALAKNVDVSEDLTTYTFTLRDTQWSNGKPVTAHDFEYAWKKAISPHFDTSFGYVFYVIKNAKAAKENRLPIEEVGVEALDDTTLRVELEHPAFYFLEIVANPLYAPVSREVEEEDPQWNRKVGDNFVCNGPFRLAKWDHNSMIQLVRNAAYWDAEAVKLDGISFSIVEDPLTSWLMFEKGEIDWVGQPFCGLPVAVVQDLYQKGRLEMHTIGGVYWYEFNVERAPFTSASMRKAFAYAINRQAIVDHVLQTGEEPAFSILPKSMALREGNAFPDGDFEKARQLFREGLRELGLTKETFPPIVLSYSGVGLPKAVAETIQQQWNRAFGIQVQLEVVEWNIYLDKFVTHDFQVAGSTWSPYFNDPIYNLEYLKYKSNRFNATQWEDPKYIALLDASDWEKEPKKRKELLKQAEDILIEQMPLTPIYYANEKYVKKNNVKDVILSDFGAVDFKWAYKTQERGN